MPFFLRHLIVSGKARLKDDDHSGKKKDAGQSNKTCLLSPLSSTNITFVGWWRRDAISSCLNKSIEKDPGARKSGQPIRKGILNVPTILYVMIKAFSCSPYDSLPKINIWYNLANSRLQEFIVNEKSEKKRTDWKVHLWSCLFKPIYIYIYKEHGQHCGRYINHMSRDIWFMVIEIPIWSGFGTILHLMVRLLSWK